MNETVTSEKASRILEAIRVLEKLEANGTITANEQSALDRARKNQKTAEQASLETKASYGGMLDGGTMNFNDEIRGAYNYANELLK